MTAEEYNLINANIETIYTISNGGYIDIRKIIFNHLCKNNSRYKKYRDEIESMNQEWFENYLEANDYNFDPYNDKDDAMVLEKHRQGFYIDVLNEYNSIIQKIKMDAYRHEQDIGFGIDKRSKYSVEIALKIQKLINEELLNIPSKDDEQKLVYHDLDRYGFDNKILGPYKKYWKYYDEDGALLENVY